MSNASCLLAGKVPTLRTTKAAGADAPLATGTIAAVLLWRRAGSTRYCCHFLDVMG